ncbi:siphovirus Gp157 family protein [Eubacterium callanderi]|uniref:siphovirus Gp157 family protein n=1 Tax=Eubacterium callanderi TaxID=53442 RepID=UPI0008E0047F|nr:siphovirus Gp157 family protein [Eubacterium callanderi]MCB6658296.1 siphovirus Gp157 family protein [Eubacterium callanderi]MCB6750421.1 siphovirus Gp157 family protein [Eubacterium callanderi]MCB7102038.1 siphovirus Gp157 family protein [Eubacterium callanderi]MCG4818206.1 siphovirus Gp157 family protein [Eubacterium callanderi]MCQ5188553.1 siphovirus Gp157 family protein [Eubacterium callanderi]
MKLYEITDIYNGVLSAIENEECTAESMEEALKTIEDDFENKVDAIACMIKGLNANINGIKAEEEALKKRRESAAKRADWLKGYLSSEMLAIGKKKVETPRNKLSFRPSVSVLIDDELALKALHPELTTVKTVVTPDKNAIKAELKKGVHINGAYLVEKQNLQIK